MTDNFNNAHIPDSPNPVPINTRGAPVPVTSTVREEIAAGAGASHAGNTGQAKVTPIPASGSRGA
jgi:hypothetical protein